MPGTLVQDANLLTNLADNATPPGTAAVTITATQNGTGLEVDRPRLVRFKLTVASIGGTSPTFDVEIQGSDTSNFSSTVSYGRFATHTANGTFFITAYVYSSFVRARVVVGGTSPTAAVTVVVEEPHWEALQGPASATPDTA